MVGNFDVFRLGLIALVFCQLDGSCVVTEQDNRLLAHEIQLLDEQPNEDCFLGEIA